MPRWTSTSAHRADDIAAATIAGVRGFKDPALRLLAASKVQELGTELAEVKVLAVRELRARGWTYRKIGSVIGVGKQRAYGLEHVVLPND